MNKSEMMLKHRLTVLNELAVTENVWQDEQGKYEYVLEKNGDFYILKIFAHKFYYTISDDGTRKANKHAYLKQVKKIGFKTYKGAIKRIYDDLVLDKISNRKWV